MIDQRGRWVIKPLYDNIELVKDYAIVYKDGDFKKQIVLSDHHTFKLNLEASKEALRQLKDYIEREYKL